MGYGNKSITKCNNINKEDEGACCEIYLAPEYGVSHLIERIGSMGETGGQDDINAFLFLLLLCICNTTLALMIALYFYNQNDPK